MSVTQRVSAREAITIICAGGWARVLHAMGRCHHCGAKPEADGDHSCPCPFHDNDCPDHPTPNDSYQPTGASDGKDSWPAVAGEVMAPFYEAENTASQPSQTVTE